MTIAAERKLQFPFKPSGLNRDGSLLSLASDDSLRG
jgi:hypothetical protein